MNRRLSCLLLVLLASSASCGKGNREPGTTGAPGAQAVPPAAAAMPPAAAAEAAPVPSMSAPAPATAGGSTVTWTAPEGWVEETPSSSMRRAQYRVPGPGGDAECQVFYFGPGQGGDAMENAKRWGGQFTNPDGSPAIGSMLTSRRNVNGLNVLIVEVKGTYTGAMSMSGAPPAPPMPGAMLMGAIAEGKDSNWFFKLIGPEMTVKARRDSFMSLVRSLTPAA